ncbi:MAG: alpha/beta fold hydrolase [Rhizobiaceae bacterium]
MNETKQTPSFREFNHDGAMIIRESLRTSMADGVYLASLRYWNEAKSHNPLPQLLCLADELGRAKDHHRLAIALLSQKKRPAFAHALSLRGRGASDAKGVADTSAINDADDLISYCDARNLHHIDIVVSGRSIYTLLLALVKRPGLPRRVVLNDAAPEFDAVAIARETALNQRSKAPASWEDAVRLLRDRKGEAFPAFSDEDWEHAASIRWHDIDGKPAPTNDKRLVRFSNAVDYDAPQPRLWTEFKLLRRTPALLVRGENSTLVTPEIVDQMKAAHAGLRVETATGQGHVPALQIDDLPQRISDFLAS